MKIKDIMTDKPEFITPETTLRQAAQKMRDCDCGYLPVGENDRLVGAVTDRDITIRATAEGRDPDTTMVREIMTPRIISCFENDDVSEAARVMEQAQIRRLVILNRNKRMVGVISLGDIATRCRDADLAGEIESEVCRKAA